MPEKLHGVVTTVTGMQCLAVNVVVQFRLFREKRGFYSRGAVRYDLQTHEERRRLENRTCPGKKEAPMETCRTKPLVANFSGCLVESPSCGHAVRYGFSFLCEHPNHYLFHAPDDQAELNAQYQRLRHTRRKRYYAELRQNHADNPALADLIEALQQTQ
jgi:hypothetical protein